MEVGAIVGKRAALNDPSWLSESGTQIRAVNLELLKHDHGNLKFICNETAIVFFPATQQHRDIKLLGLSYEDDHRGNALAGLVGAEKVELTCVGLAPHPNQSSLVQIAQFRSQSLQHARFGDAHRACGHPEFGGDFRRREAVDGRAPEGLPGAFGKLAADQFECSKEKLPLRFIVGRRRVGGPQ